MENVFNLKVEEEFKGLRLDKWISTVLPDFSRTKIQKLIKDGFVLDNNEEVVADQNLKVIVGDEYIISIPEEKHESLMEPEDIPLDILFEDDDIIVVNKSAGMVVHKGAGVKNGTLVNALLFHLKGNISSIGMEAGRPGIVHRLDKDTSGVMMACKTDKAHLEMYKQFSNHSVNRDYLAILWGMANPISGRIEKNIARNPRARQEMTVAVNSGKHAVTNYETLEIFSGAKFKPLSLVKCKLETGRTHQIRVHMSSIGVPILGDSVYGNPSRHITQIEDENVRNLVRGVKRQMLHSKNIEFIHPITKKVMKFNADVPDDMKEIIEFFKGE